MSLKLILVTTRNTDTFELRSFFTAARHIISTLIVFTTCPERTLNLHPSTTNTKNKETTISRGAQLFLFLNNRLFLKYLL